VDSLAFEMVAHDVKPEIEDFDLGHIWSAPIGWSGFQAAGQVRKVNIDTDLRLAATSAIRRRLMSKPSEFDPRKYLKPAMDSMKSQCIDTFEAFGTVGQAEDIRVRSLPAMALAY
jgi:fructose-bisphosphate aldolase, class II